MITPVIFQIEDDEDFAFFMQCAIKEIDNDITVTILANGKVGMETLYTYQELKQLPKLILLDLELPGISGIEILKIIRAIPDFDKIPVVLFSTSNNPRHVRSAQEFGANEYQVKPLGYLSLVNSLKLMHINYININ